MTVPDAREDIAVFAEQVLGRPLWPHQLEAARSGRFITTVAKARRTGGTELIKTLAAWTCFRERGVKAVVLSAGLEAARRITEELGAELGASRLTRGSVVDDFATRIRLVNGSEIVSLPASQRAVRGLGKGVKLLVVDEAGFVAEDLWRAAHYVALDERGNGGRVVLVGTPWGSGEMFFRRAYEDGLAGDPEHGSFHWTYEANPNLDHAYLERQWARVSPPEYAAEVLGEWSDAAGALFPRELLERATADVEVPGLMELPSRPRPLVGTDWGVSFDRSAAVMLYRVPVAALNPGVSGPVFVALPYVWPAGAALSGVVADVVASPARPVFLATETNGVGAMPSQELARLLGRRCRVVFVGMTAGKKTAAFGAVLGLLERGQLVLPRRPDLLRQLAGLRFEQGERGFTRIEADDPATHDDVADGLALSMVPFVPVGVRGSRVRCLAPKLAAKYPVEGEVPPLDEPVVETGDGMRLYRRPALQSVNGPELVLPVGARVRDLRREAELARQEALRARVWAHVNEQEAV